jgi:hypothetical protein
VSLFQTQSFCYVESKDLHRGTAWQIGPPSNALRGMQSLRERIRFEDSPAQQGLMLLGAMRRRDEEEAWVGAHQLSKRLSSL